MKLSAIFATLMILSFSFIASAGQSSKARKPTQEDPGALQSSCSTIVKNVISAALSSGEVKNLSSRVVNQEDLNKESTHSFLKIDTVGTFQNDSSNWTEWKATFNYGDAVGCTLVKFELTK